MSAHEAALWRTYDATEQRLSAPLSARMIALAGLTPGMQVLDLATGRGEPAVAAARRVAPTGRVLGIDRSAEILELARARAAAEGVANLELRALAAEALDLGDARFDATLCRWGLMYFDAPVHALAIVRRALRPGAPLVLAVWDEPARVPYYTLPRQMLAPYRALPPIDIEVPGTFRYADEARLVRDLAAVGFAVTHVEDLEVAVMEAHTDAELVAWCRAFGLNRLLADLPAQTQARWEADLVRAAAPLWEGGVIRLGGTTRLVLAC
jgi:ubiquinone/menaquinone biosynthesis C-methylase UbiE